MQDEKVVRSSQHDQPRPMNAANSPLISRGRAKKPDRGLPAGKALVDLARTYLGCQRQHWPALVQNGTLPPLSDEALTAMADAFSRDFLAQAVTRFDPTSFKRPWEAVAASYIRYSDDSSNPRSLDQQLKLQLDRARENNHFIPWNYVFADAAVSATTADRQGYKLAKQALGLEDVGLLYIDEIGRASRNAIEALRLGRLIDDLHKRLIGVSDNFDTTSQVSKLMLSLYAMINEWFVDQLRKKVDRGMKDAFGRGTNIHPLPVGYDLVPAVDRNGNPIVGREGDQLNAKVVNEEEAGHVRWAFTAFGRENKSPHTIARRFNELAVGGVVSWDDCSVRQMLRRYTYAGIEVYGRSYQKRDPETGKRKTYERPKSEWRVRRARSLQILPWSLWKAVKKRLEVCKTANNRDLKPGAMTRPEIYPNVLIRPICGSCGTKLSLGRSGKYASFFCSNGSSGKNRCRFRGYKTVRIVDDAILAELRQRVFTSEFLASVLESANRQLANVAGRPREDTAPLQARLRNLEAKRNRLAVIIESQGEDGLDGLIKNIRGYEREIKEVREQLARVRAKNEPPPPMLQEPDLQGLLDNMRDVLAQDVPASAAMLKKLTGPITVDQVEEEGKKKPTWVARFTLNLVPVLIDLAASRNCPTRNTWEFLNMRGWTISETVEVRIETTKRYLRFVEDVVELVSQGQSINTAASKLGITWQEARDALVEDLDLSKPKKCLIQGQVQSEKLIAMQSGAELSKLRKLFVSGRGRIVGRSLALRRADAVAEYSEVILQIRKDRETGLTFATIAERLNEKGFSTRRGKSWSATQVGRALTLCKKDSAFEE